MRTPEEDRPFIKAINILAVSQTGGRGGDRWLADKGFLVQHILDNRGWGVRLETPVKLEGKKQFSEEEDIHNRRTSQARGHI